MGQSTFVLTSSPFILDQIHLASFVPDIRQPHQDAKRSYEVKETDYSIQDDTDFDGLISTSSSTFFKALATKCLALSLTHNNGDTLHVTAERGRIFWLNSPASLFEEIVFGDHSGEEIQMWLERCQRRGISPRFVVAYRTFVDAQLSRDQQRATEVSVHGRAPISTALGDPSGVADLGVGAGGTRTASARGMMGTPGERIYAICYRKVRLSRERGRLTASLDQSNKWRSFAAERDDAGDEEYFQVDLDEGDDDEDYELYDVEGSDGRKLLFAVAPE